MWSNYMMKLCYDEGIVVVQHNLATRDAMLLVPGEPAVKLGPQEVDDALDQHAKRHPLYLCDTGQDAHIVPVQDQQLHGVLVVTAAPDPKHFGQWSKESVPLWLPPWTSRELKTALPHLLVDNRPHVVEQVPARYDQVGGSLRQLAAGQGPLNNYLQSITEACKGLTVEALGKVVDDVLETNPKSGVLALNVSHKLLHV